MSADQASRSGPLVLMGPIASGKTTAARLLSERLTWPVISFGAYVRAEAQRRGIALERGQLEGLGAHLIATRGHEQFLRDVLQGQVSAVEFVLEGVRHVDMLRAVKRLFGSATSVYLHVSADQRYQRWLQRERLTDAATARVMFDEVATGEVERHVYALELSADLVADGLLPTEDIAQLVLDFVASDRG
jgi:dephospho-CoA kinase